MSTKLLIFFIFASITTFANSEIDAKHHRHHHSRVHVGLGVATARPTYIVSQPTPVLVPAPVIAYQPYPTQVYQHYYVEQAPVQAVYVQPTPIVIEHPRPSGHVNWNFSFHL